MGTTVETKTLFTLKTTILRLRSSRALASTQYQRNVETCRRLHSSRRYAFLIWRLIFYTFDGLPTIFKCITTKTLERALYIRERIYYHQETLFFVDQLCYCRSQSCALTPAYFIYTALDK